MDQGAGAIHDIWSANRLEPQNVEQGMLNFEVLRSRGSSRHPTPSRANSLLLENNVAGGSLGSFSEPAGRENNQPIALTNSSLEKPTGT